MSCATRRPVTSCISGTRGTRSIAPGPRRAGVISQARARSREQPTKLGMDRSKPPVMGGTTAASVLERSKNVDFLEVDVTQAMIRGAANRLRWLVLAGTLAGCPANHPSNAPRPPDASAAVPLHCVSHDTQRCYETPARCAQQLQYMCSDAPKACDGVALRCVPSVDPFCKRGHALNGIIVTECFLTRVACEATFHGGSSVDDEPPGFRWDRWCVARSAL